MTLEDNLSPTLGELAEEREPWTIERLAEELYLRNLVRARHDLNAWITSLGATPDMVVVDPSWAQTEDLETIGRLRTLLEVIRAIRFSDIARAAARLEQADAEARFAAGRNDEARRSQAEALRWADLAAEAERAER